MALRFLFILAAAVAAQALAAPAPEDPEGCNATSVGAVLVAFLEGDLVPPGVCVVPGEVIDYEVVLFVPENFVPYIFCDVEGGQLSVTLPPWSSVPPGPFVPVAGYLDTPAIRQFGNGDGLGVPFIIVVPQAYTVAEADAPDGLLHARADYGQTAFIRSLDWEQANGTYLSQPELATATAVAKSAVPLCVPQVTLEKEASVAEICEGVKTEVTYTLLVSNPGEVGLTELAVSDPDCEPLYVDGDGDEDGRLDPGETWVYTCSAVISSTTSNTATASAMAVSFTGQPVKSVKYAAQAKATVQASDAGPPLLLACPPRDLVLVADAQGEALLPDLVPLVSAEDDCTPIKSLVLAQMPLAGTPLTVGPTSVVVEILDLAGNASSCTSNVEVVPLCAGDLNGDRQVDVLDLVIVVLAIGPCPGKGECPADVNDDGEVDVVDLTAVILSWGRCR